MGILSLSLQGPPPRLPPFIGLPLTTHWQFLGLKALVRVGCMENRANNA